MKNIKSFEKFINEQQYWGSIAAGILPVCVKTQRVLLNLRSSQVYEPNTWNLFSGKLDIDEGVDETIAHAALRELREESQFDGEIHLIPGYVFKDGNKFEFHNFIGIVEEEYEPVLNWESDDAQWMTLQEVMKLHRLHPGFVKFLKNSYDLIINALNGKYATA